MNNRIKELIKQSERVDHYTTGDYFPVMTVDGEKLAQLIIAECLGNLKERIALRYQGSEKDRDIGYGMEIVYDDIVSKFGVE